MNRRDVFTLLSGTAAALAMPRNALAAPPRAADVLERWYKLVLLLVRHTPIYSPPVASRAFAYMATAVYETTAAISPGWQSLAGQLNGLKEPPYKEKPQGLDLAHALHGALEASVSSFFVRTGPSGQRALKSTTRKISADLAGSVSDDVAARSEDFGRSIATRILEWSDGDGGAVIDNMGFPMSFKPQEGKEHWVPTSTIGLQQAPLLPNWGNNRTFAMPDGGACPIKGPPAYSEEKDSPFYKEALEVYDTIKNLKPEQRAIARFWSDDPMLSPTPPGHWISIAMQVAKQRGMTVEECTDMLMRVSVAVADGFIACWRVKFEVDLLRPVTYIKRVIDPKWNSVLITPPFPEYPSGHSTQSGAAATALTALLGDNVAFEDATHARDGLPARSFKNFWEAANEAGISRLYGGIHYRAAIDDGLEQGRCVGTYAANLKTRV